MDANDFLRMQHARNAAIMVEKVNSLITKLESGIDKFDCIEEMEFDPYPYQVIADINLTNGHHIRVPFSVFADPKKSTLTLIDMVRMTSEL